LRAEAEQARSAQESAEDTAAGLRGLAIEDAVWCGVCHPRPEPIPVEFLDAQPPT